SRLRIEIAGAAMMIYLQKRVIDQNGRSPSSFEKAKIRCGMTVKTPAKRSFFTQTTDSRKDRAKSNQ
ncbi:hypothetical protein ACEUBS_19690, partial [Aeromonas veronii]